MLVQCGEYGLFENGKSLCHVSVPSIRLPLNGNFRVPIPPYYSQGLAGLLIYYGTKKDLPILKKLIGIDFPMQIGLV